MTEEKQNSLIDFTKYTEKQNTSLECVIKNKTNIIKECSSVSRIVNGLVYLSLLNKQKRDFAIFSNFLSEIYPYYTDDMIHIIRNHDNDLEIISNVLLNQPHFVKCDINNCLVSDRHCNVTDGKNGSIIIINNDDEENVKYAFHQREWDKIHYYIAHIFEMGLRLKSTNVQVANNNEAKEMENDDLVDVEFKLQRLMLNKKIDQLARFKNEITDTSSKFNIQTVEVNKETFLDAFYENIAEIINTETEVSTLKQFLNEEHFDSDAIKDDLHKDSTFENSNILGNAKSEQSSETIRRFVSEVLVETSGFSIGFTFFYWKYFSPDNKDRTEKKQWHFNRNDLGGFSEADLFVKMGKFENLKDEIINNSHNLADSSNFEEYHTGLYPKAEGLIQSEKVKSIRADFDEDDFCANFDIDVDESISIRHIMALLLYTDYSKLSTSFSATFRRKSGWETLSSVKKRNQQFYHMSKALIEAVNCFGNCGLPESGPRQADDEYGPFYCGINCILSIGSFRIRLNAPTSTTKELIVANRFADVNGIILSLNNTSMPCHWCAFFNVSYMSRYPEEAERLFVHGDYPLQLETVRLTRLLHNYKKQIKVLAVFDEMTSGDWSPVTDKCTQKDVKMLNLLLKEDTSVPAYILDTVKLFKNNKKMLVINLPYITDSDYPLYLQDLMLCKSSAHGYSNYEYNAQEVNDLNSNKNLLSEALLPLFPNLKDIIIYCVDVNGSGAYQFSINSLISIIQKWRFEKWSLYGTWKYGKRSWLFDMYKSVNWGEYPKLQVDIVQTSDPYNRTQDLLTIALK